MRAGPTSSARGRQGPEPFAGRRRRARRRPVPHLSGQLAGSVEASSDDEGAGVGYGGGVAYAGWIEFGGSRGRPYVPEGRYLYPTALEAQDEFATVAAEAADRHRQEVLMVDTVSVNGDELVEHAERVELPEIVQISTAEARRIPSPGAQRALKAETGRGFDQLCGPEADWRRPGPDADLDEAAPRSIRGLRWADCDEVTVQVEEGALDVDPTKLVGSASSPPSADSGD